MTTAQAPVARRDFGGALTLGAIAGAGVWVGAAMALSKLLLPAEAVAKYNIFQLQQLWPYFFERSVKNEMFLLLPAAAGTAVFTYFFLILASEKVRPEVHADGPQLRRGAGAAREAIKKEATRSDVICTVAGIKLTIDRIRRSFLILGSIGSGKTVTIWSLIKALIPAGYKLLIIDGPKGDYSQTLDKALIIAPWHNGPAWDIAADCSTRNHARELAKSLIPVSEKEPLWGNAAGMVFVAIICKLQATQGQKWGWVDIYEHIILTVPELKNIAEQYYPPAVQVVADAESKTTQSVVINLTAYMSDVYEMALAWKNVDKKFSFTNWWQAEGKGPQIVILQGSGEFQSLAGGYISSIINTLATLTASPSFPESKTRKNCVVIDEMAQLPKLAGVQKFLEIGRSKGASAILATQSPAQLVEIYGQNSYSAWAAMVGTKVFCRILGYDDAQVALKEIGEREIYRPATTVTKTAGGESISSSYTKEKTGVISQADLAELGPEKTGVKTILAGVGKDPIELVFPFTDTTPRRPAFIKNPDFNKPTVTVTKTKTEEAALEGSDIKTEEPEPADITAEMPEPAVFDTSNDEPDFNERHTFFLQKRPEEPSNEPTEPTEPADGELSEAAEKDMAADANGIAAGAVVGIDAHILSELAHAADLYNEVNTCDSEHSDGSTITAIEYSDNDQNTTPKKKRLRRKQTEHTDTQSS